MKKVLSKILILSLVGSLMLGLSACQKKDNEVPNNPVDNPSQSDNLPDNTTPDNTTPDDSSNQPIQNEVEVSLLEVAQTIRDTYGESYLPSMRLDQETFNALIGLEDEEANECYSEYFAEVAMISAQVDKLFIAKTDDTNKMLNVFGTYMDNQITDAIQYPMNLTKLNNYNLIVKGDYVILAILGAYPDTSTLNTEGMTDEEAMATEEEFETNYYKEQNDLLVTAMDSLFENGFSGEVILSENPVSEPTNNSLGEEENAEGSDVTENIDNTENVEGTNVNVENTNDAGNVDLDLGELENSPNENEFD